jgi:putative DNA primase/helicase
MFPGLVIPMHTPAGGRISAQWKPWTPVTHNGNKRKYACPVGEGNRIDVHPRNKDKIVEVSDELWLTEGIKKADSLTSRGICAAAMNGVFGWKASLGTVGDWENILLKGREVTICFDSDARTKRQVLDAMIRLGKWLRQVKKAKRVHYLIVPNEYSGTATKGVDDYFAQVEPSLSSKTCAPPPHPPPPTWTHDSLKQSWHSMSPMNSWPTISSGWTGKGG